MEPGRTLPRGPRESQQIAVVHQREPFHRGFLTFLVDIWRNRGLLTAFVRKDLMVKYRGSVLGLLWTMIRPLVQLAVYGLVMGIFLGLGQSIPNFAFYMFVGIAAFGLFSEASITGANSVLAGAPLVKKIAFRRELLPLASVGGALVNYFFLNCAMVIAYLVTRTHPNWGSVGLVIPALLILVLFATGCALLVSALNVYARDTAFILEVVLLVMFWLTPVIYPWSAVKSSVENWGLPDWLFQLYMLNPITDAVVALQQALWPGAPAGQANADAALAAGQPAAPFNYFDSMWATTLWLQIAIGVCFVWLAQRLFSRMQSGFAAEL